MTTAQLGTPIANFQFATTENPQSSFLDLRGKTIVLYFYPKDNTPGCTMESKDFRDLYSQFLAADACILGISRDNLSSHEKFIANCDLPFSLISDGDEALCRYFDVIKEKNMYGKKVMGIERSTFLINSQGVLIQEWRKVKVEGHAQEVLAAVKLLQ